MKSEDSLTTAVAAEICRALEGGNTSFQVASWIETTESGEELLRMYGDTQCRPLWINEEGIDHQALYMIHAVKHSADDGLDIYDPAYNLESILSLMGEIESDTAPDNKLEILAQLDILLSDAYMMVGKHLYNGVLPRDRASLKWAITVKKPLDFPRRLREALLKNTLLESLDQLAPSSYPYQALKRILEKYHQIEEHGGWKTIEPLYPKGYPVEEIKERLRAEGDLSMDENSVEEYHNALIHFQKRHGIKADGIVGIKTLSKLNIPVEEKIETVRLNMERWRWMPQNIDSSHIAVNLPDFSLSLIYDGTAVMNMSAIIGKEERPTPIFNANMTNIVVNPYWRVPNTILQEDVIPSMGKDIRYLKKNKIRIFKYTDQKGKEEINPASIDWENVSAETFPYFLRQDSGWKNVLGHLKFMFPNPYDIYIHDTPEKYLFEKDHRAFSSGCIRIEEPDLLAEYLLATNDSAVSDEQNITEVIESGKTQKIPLLKPMRVYINYWTVWEDEEGTVQFRDDIYGYDRELAEALGWYNGIRY